jgi:hypothetical protein
MKKRDLARTALAILVTAFFGCATSTIVTPPVQEVTVQIEGTVTELATGIPIEGALAEVRTITTGTLFAEALSDSTGAYSLTFLYRYFEGDRNFCPFIFIISRQGYVGDTPSFDCINDVQTINVQLQNTALAAGPID